MARGTALQFLMAGMTDASGLPLAGGKVYCYAAGTNAPKTIYTNSDLTSGAAYSVVLDAQGRALVFGEGNYKFVIKTAADATLYTWDEVYINPVGNLEDTTEILQVQNSTLRSTTSSTPATYGGCSGVVTVTGSSDKVLLIAELVMSGATANKLADISLLRGSTVLLTKRVSVAAANANGYGSHAVALYIDAPSGGANTYSIQWSSVDNSTYIYSLSGSLTAFVLRAI